MKSHYIIIEYNKEEQTMTFTGVNEKLESITVPKTMKVTTRSKAGQKLNINSTDTEAFLLYYPTSSRIDLHTPEIFKRYNDIKPDKLPELNPDHYYTLLPKRYLVTKDFAHLLKMVQNLTGRENW